jgi:hypothetical protein
MRNTVYGIVCDDLGHAASETLQQGAYGPQLRMRAWATPAAQVRQTQPARIPIDYAHDGRELGQIVYLERDKIGRLWAVGQVEEWVTPAVDVNVAGRTVTVETDLYWSASRLSTDNFEDVVIDSIALTPATAKIAARPVQFLRGALDHRSAPDRWRQLDGYQRELVERATVVHLDRRRDGGPILVHDAKVYSQRSTHPAVIAEMVEDDYFERKANMVPLSQLRWRPGVILGVR